LNLKRIKTSLSLNLTKTKIKIKTTITKSKTIKTIVYKYYLIFVIVTILFAIFELSIFTTIMLAFVVNCFLRK